MNLIVRRLLMMFALPVMERAITKTLKRVAANRKAKKAGPKDASNIVDSTLVDDVDA